MKIRRRPVSFVLVPVVLLTVLLSVPQAVAAGRKSFLWKVRSGAATVYLLGSIHFMRKEVYPLPREMEEAFDRSRFLVVEANVSDIGKIDIMKIAEKAFYPTGETLRKHVSAETYESVRRETEKLGLPSNLIDQQRPWFLALTLESLAFIKSGMDPRYGIDLHFLSKAGDRKVLELESIDYQIDLLSGLSERDQELLILYTVKELGEARKKADHLVEAWQSGDTEGLESIATSEAREDPGLSAIYEKIVLDRNRSMAGRIEEFFRTGETYFVVVGAAHLVGSRGVVELLRSKGHTVEQVLISGGGP
jgi:uncharacterized protein